MINKRIRFTLTQLVVTLCFLALFLSLVHADVTLTVGDGSGFPGSSENPVIVSLENQDEQVRGLRVDVCDVDDYLTCTACELTDRTADFSCSVNEITNPDNPFYGCCRVMLFNPPLLIGVGQGSIVTLKYDVSSGAPSGCIDLNPEEVQVADENGDPFPSDDVVSEPGEFCFVSSTTTTAASTTTTVRESPCPTKEIYGENAEEVAFLRNFRDHILSKTPSGRELIRLYYQLSPAIVKAVEENEALREEVKKIIDATLPLIGGEVE